VNHTFSEIELRKLDLNLLLVFSAVMRERNVGRAAARLYLGASAISMALNRLRGAVGDPLFVRAGVAMQPTPRAVALWAAIEPALSSIEAAVRGMRAFDPASVEMTIRFAAPDDLEFVLVPRLIEQLAASAPGVRLVVRPSDFRTLMDRLDVGDADLALSATPTSGLERRYIVRPLHEESFAVLFDAAQMGTVGPLDLDTFADAPQVLLSIAGDLHGPIDDALAQLGRSRRVLAAVTHFPTIPFVLRRLPAVASVPATAARYYAASYNLALSPLPIVVPSFEVALIWHARTAADPAHAWFRQIVAGAVTELRNEGGSRA